MLRNFPHFYLNKHDKYIKWFPVHLSVSNIEEVGLMEVLQPSGAKYGNWDFLEELLVEKPHNESFVFENQLAAAREVKVSLSCLFGRFVARTYLQKYFGMTNFFHLQSDEFTLGGPKNIKIKRRAKGNLPDWIAIDKDYSNLMVAEVKGCHPSSGLKATIDRAWKQANRVEIDFNGNSIPLHRIAIVAHWGFTDGKTETPTKIYVKYSVDDHILTKPILPKIIEVIYLSLLREHLGRLLLSFGGKYEELANNIMEINQSTNIEEEESNISSSLISLNRTPKTEIENTERNRIGPISRLLIGTVVTKAGKIRIQNVTEDDVAKLMKLKLQPYFVGFDCELIEKIINGNLGEIQDYISENLSYPDQNYFRPDWSIQENRIKHPYNEEIQRILYSQSTFDESQETAFFGSDGPNYCNFNGWTFPLGTGQFKIKFQTLQ